MRFYLVCETADRRTDNPSVRRFKKARLIPIDYETECPEHSTTMILNFSELPALRGHEPTVGIPVVYARLHLTGRSTAAMIWWPEITTRLYEQICVRAFLTPLVVGR
jgi:hypothetical protein